MPAKLFDFDIVLNKAQKYCAYQERCQWDMEKKFRDWQVDEEIRDEVLAELIIRGFILFSVGALYFLWVCLR